MSRWQSAMSTWRTAKPRVIALAVGLVAGPLLTNYIGYQQTSSSARSQLRAAVVEAQAVFCEASARADIADPGKLDWTARSELAKKWSVMPKASASDPDVASECASKLAG